MPRLILNQDEVTLKALADHLDDSGFDVETDSEPDALVFHSERGLGFVIKIDEDRKFIQFKSFFPIRNDFLDSIEFCNSLNFSVFLGKFCIDHDGDLCTAYLMSYERGLITAQFSRIYQRFSSMLDYVLERDVEKTVFDFDKKSPAPSQMEAPLLIQ